MKIPSIILLSTLLVLLSCTNLEINRKLNDIESYIQERPDSALLVLEKIDGSSLKNNRNRAHHALLHAMALDKNYINVTDDSLARTALNHFEKWGPAKYKARALFYLGVYYYNTNAYNDAIVQFTESEDLCREIGDMLYCYLSISNQADTYNKMYNDEEEYRCVCEAKDIVYKHQLTKYTDFVDLRLGQAYINRKEYSKASDIFNQIINKSDCDSLILGHAISSLAFLELTKDDINPRQAAELYSIAYYDFNGAGMKINDYWAWAASLYLSGKINDYYEITESLNSESDNCHMYYWKYLISRHEEDYIEALKYLEIYGEKSNNEATSALQQSLALSQRNYYEGAAREMKQKALNRLYLIIISILSCGLILIIACSIIGKLKNERIKLIQFAEQISKLVTEEQNENNKIRKKYIELYQSKFNIVRKLCDHYFASQNRIDAEKIIYKKVSELINGIRNDEHNKSKIEKMLNQDLDGIMMNLRAEMPKLKEIDYSLFAYIVIGLDAITISQLIEMTESNIYAHKRRIRIKIQEKHPAHEEQFLAFL